MASVHASHRLTVITLIGLTLVCVVFGSIGGWWLLNAVTQSNQRIQLASNAEYGRRFAFMLESQLEMGVEPERVLEYVRDSFVNNLRDENRYLCVVAENGELLCHPNQNNVGWKGFNELPVKYLASEETVPYGSLKAKGVKEGYFLKDGKPAELIRRIPLRNAPWEVVVHTDLKVLDDENRMLRNTILATLLPIGFCFILFGTMVVRLLGRDYEAAIEESNRTLEARVQERTSELTRSMLELQQARDALLMKEKMAILGQLVAGIAHEVKNPLHAIALNVQFLEEEIEDQDYKDAARNIRQSADRCDKLVKSLLSFSRNDPPNPEVRSLNDVIQSALALCSAELRKNHVQLNRQFASENPLVTIDQIQIEQVVLNLVLNAASALQDQSEPREVIVTTEDGEKNVLITIEDNGPGLPGVIEDHLFEAFRTTKEDGQGTGLGLSLCRRFVEAHGGTIAYERGIGGGAKFIVTLRKGNRS